jgi:electron transport complex protein RnfE
MAEKSLFQEFTKGIVKENPVLRLVLGTCSTLAITTAASNAIGMGLATTFVLVCSNAVISIMRNIIPDKIRIPAYITIIAGFVTIVQLIVKAYAPALEKSLGVYLPLIVVNCIILGRAEMYANKHKVLPSIIDGLGMGIGFMAALLSMGIIREFFGAGSFFDIPVITMITESIKQTFGDGRIYQFVMQFTKPIIIFLLPPGGFFVFGFLVALAGKLSGDGKAPESVGCASCPLAGNCAAEEPTITADSNNKISGGKENENG